MKSITIDMDKIAQVLEGAKRGESTSHPKIQKVLHNHRNQDHLVKYYLPRLVSFGPIHYNKPNLQLGEKYKLMWTAMYVEDTHINAENLYQKIANNIMELKLLYTQDALQDFTDENLAKMLFFDGCSLLQVMGKKSEELKVKDNQLLLVHQDMLLLENQLPFQVLQLLSDDNEANLMKTMNEFLRYRLELSHGLLVQDEEDAEINIDDSPPPRPPHLLHHLRQKMLLGFSPDFDSEHKFILPPTYKNIKELRAAGIRVKQKDRGCWLQIDFKSHWFGGELRIPKIIIDDRTGSTYMNLIAYEMCPDFENDFEISAYVQFLDSLIDQPYDVKELRSAGILHNAFGSDEDVAKLFNVIGADLVPDIKVYAWLRYTIAEYYSRQKCQIWLAEAYDTYFRSPWTIMATLAAFLVLVLTFIQTWFVIYPSKQTYI